MRLFFHGSAFLGLCRILGQEKPRTVCFICVPQGGTSVWVNSLSLQLLKILFISYVYVRTKWHEVCINEFDSTDSAKFRPRQPLCKRLVLDRQVITGMTYTEVSVQATLGTLV